jgi:hypothetical protein
MTAPDLRNGPPRRWSASVDGVIWLPRLIDKCRAHDAGTLGTYLYGQSPVDDAFLALAGLDYPSFTTIVRANAGDAAVLAGIEARAPGATARLQTWSQQRLANPTVFIRMNDWDDGYSSTTGNDRVLRAIIQPLFGIIVTLFRIARPLRP